MSHATTRGDSKMTSTNVRSVTAGLCAAVLALAGCGDNGTEPPPPGSDPPTAPTDVAATVIDGGDVEVTWKAPDDADTQTVTLTPDNSVVSEVSQDVGGTATSATVSDVGRATTFEVTVTATNDGGSTASDIVNVTTPEIAFNNLLADPGLPDAAFSIGSRTSPPDFAPTAMPPGYSPFDVSTLNGAAGLVMPGDGRTLEATSYAGAVAPGTSVGNAWYSDWTIWAADGSDSRSMGAATATLSGTIASDRTLSADTTYLLDGPVFVGEDCGIDGSASGCNAVTLTIEPGTTLMGLSTPGDPDVRGSFLTVTRGSQIIADAHHPDFGGSGVCEKPAESDVIVFTSDQPAGSRARGDWGGLVLNGQAPLNTGDEAQGEGDSGLYGGNDENDSSGVLRGVRVEFAGDDVTATDQLNGIAFQGVGAGTTVCYAQVAYNVDDGTEPFGGTVSQTHMVMTGIGDDSFDGTDGWQGFLQFGIAQQRADDADQGFEFSTEGDDPSATPPSSAVVANVTLVGAGVSLGTGEIAAEGGESDIGILFREGGNYRIFNTIAVGFGASGLDVEGAQTAQNADNRYFGESTAPEDILRLESSILWSNVSQGDGDDNFADASGDGYAQGENRAFFLSGGN